MQVDIRTSSVRPIRQTFSFVARHIGADKPASRYQEATLDMQSEVNFHYRPLWQPEFELYDKRRTAIVMADWYAFKDPRHYYYGNYTMARARQQDNAEKQLDFLDKRRLLAALDEDARRSLELVLVPLRHYEWGANMNNIYCAGFGYGAAITQACTFAAMDRLGIAQYLSRIGLLIGDGQSHVLEAAKRDWLQSPAWQGVRKLMETLFVTSDWFEIFVAQNFVLDGLILPLVYRRYEAALTTRSGSPIGLATEFMNEWYEEAQRWVDASLAVAAQESAQNAARLSQWFSRWLGESNEALGPLATAALGSGGPAVLAQVRDDLVARARRSGLPV